MHTPTQKKKENNKFTISIKPWKVAIGHQQHVTGTGVHADKRTRRCRTRGAQLRAAMQD